MFNDGINMNESSLKSLAVSIKLDAYYIFIGENRRGESILF